MPQFFVRTSDISGGKCKIEGNDYRHLVAVRRAAINDIIRLRRDDGISCEARIVGISDTCIEAEITSELDRSYRPPDLTLCLSLLKGKHFDQAVARAVEIGVARIIPFISERTIPRISSSDRVNRWRTKAREAAKQSMREVIPAVENIVSFEELIKCEFEGLRIIASPGAGRSLKGFLCSIDSHNRPHSIAVLIGPEGGFSDSEIKAAVKAGWVELGFGFSQLRAGTAAEVIPAIIIYEWDDDTDSS